MTMYHGMYSSMIEAMVANKVLESNTATGIQNKAIFIDLILYLIVIIM